jgi:predicted transcriptional regulator
MKRHYTRFTKEDDAIILSEFGKTKTKELAERLGRTVSSIYHRVDKLKAKESKKTKKDIDVESTSVYSYKHKEDIPKGTDKERKPKSLSARIDDIIDDSSSKTAVPVFKSESPAVVKPALKDEESIFYDDIDTDYSNGAYSIASKVIGFLILFSVVASVLYVLIKGLE